MTDTQETASAQDSDLIDQLLMRSALAAEETKADWMLNKLLKLLSLKCGHPVLWTDRFNILCQKTSNLFGSATEIIDLRKGKVFFKTCAAEYPSATFDFGITLHSHRLSC